MAFNSQVSSYAQFVQFQDYSRTPVYRNIKNTILKKGTEIGIILCHDLSIMILYCGASDDYYPYQVAKAKQYNSYNSLQVHKITFLCCNPVFKIVTRQHLQSYAIQNQRR